MSIVRYPDSVHVELIPLAYAPGLSNRNTNRTFLEIGANKATLHFAATITEPVDHRLIMPAGSIAPEYAPPYAERGLCAMNGQPVFVIVGTTGNVTIDPQAPINLVGNDWIIGKIEWMRRAA